MVSDLLWILAALGALFWVILPAGILVLACVYRRHDTADPAEDGLALSPPEPDLGVPPGGFGG